MRLELESGNGRDKRRRARDEQNHNRRLKTFAVSESHDAEGPERHNEKKRTIHNLTLVQRFSA